MRKYITQHLSRLTVRVEAMLGPKAFELAPLQLSNLATFGERFRHRLAVHFRQFWLVIQCLQVRRSARHAQMDHPTNSRPQVQGLHDAIPAGPGNIHSVGCHSLTHE